MNNEKLDDFLISCCRVCLNIENVMVDSTHTIENFTKSIDELLFDCGNMKMLSELQMESEKFPKLICEECCAELIVVAKFREKCSMAEETLKNLIRNASEKDDFNTTESIIVAEAIALDENESNDVEFYIVEEPEKNEIILTTKDEQIAVDNRIRKKTSKDRSDMKIDSSSSTRSKTKINHNCKYCGAGFAHLNNLVKHLQTHGSVTESETIELETVTEPKSIIRKDHECSYCSKSFPSQSLLATHIRIHTNERPFGCNECSKTFRTRGALQLHQRRHSGVRPYQCPECDRGFVESSNLNVHMRTHTGEKPHKCTRCDRSFSRVFLLQIHQRTHTGERPYVCDICTRSFAQQSDLRSHKRIHSGERPHRCKVCSKAFTKSSGLTQHMRRHTKTMNSNDEFMEIIDETET